MLECHGTTGQVTELKQIDRVMQQNAILIFVFSRIKKSLPYLKLIIVRGYLSKAALRFACEERWSLYFDAQQNPQISKDDFKSKLLLRRDS